MNFSVVVDELSCCRGRRTLPSSAAAQTPESRRRREEGAARGEEGAARGEGEKERGREKRNWGKNVSEALKKWICILKMKINQNTKTNGGVW